MTKHKKVGSNANKRILRDKIHGITNPAIRRLARRGGVKRISALIYEETRSVLRVFLENVIKDSVIYTEHAKRQTLTAMDVVYALKRQGRTLYGFGGTGGHTRTNKKKKKVTHGKKATELSHAVRNNVSQPTVLNWNITDLVPSKDRSENVLLLDLKDEGFLKAFKIKKDFEHEFGMLKKFEEVGLSPKLLDSGKRGDLYWFLTERIHPKNFLDSYVNSSETSLLQKMKKLLNDTQASGLTHGDGGIHNMAIHRGNIVFIDFGMSSNRYFKDLDRVRLVQEFGVYGSAFNKIEKAPHLNYFFNGLRDTLPDSIHLNKSRTKIASPQELEDSWENLYCKYMNESGLNGQIPQAMLKICDKVIQ